MKNLWVLLTLLSMFFFGCESSDLESAQIGVKTETGIGQTATINSPLGNAHFLLVTVVSIDDSRCPVGDECIWAGEVEVKFSVGTPPFILTINQSQDIFKGNSHFVLTLLNVVPYPGSGTGVETAIYIVNRI